MKSIKTLVWALRFFGGFSIFVAVITSIGIPEMAPKGALVIILVNAPIFLWGVGYLCLAQGLSKKEIWSYYTGLIIFGLSILFAIIKVFGKTPGFEIFGGIISFWFLVKLIGAKELFITQPKEKISQWFRKPCFIIILGVSFFALISTGLLMYLLFFSEFLFK